MDTMSVDFNIWQLSAVVTLSVIGLFSGLILIVMWFESFVEYVTKISYNKAKQLKKEGK